MKEQLISENNKMNEQLIIELAKLRSRICELEDKDLKNKYNMNSLNSQLQIKNIRAEERTINTR